MLTYKDKLTLDQRILLLIITAIFLIGIAFGYKLCESNNRTKAKLNALNDSNKIKFEFVGQERDIPQNGELLRIITTDENTVYITNIN